MKKWFVLAFALMIFSPLSAYADWRHSGRQDDRYFWNQVDERLSRQNRGIEFGFRTGALSKIAARRLQREHCRISDRAQFLRRRHHLSERDKRRLWSSLDNVGKNLYDSRGGHSRKHGGGHDSHRSRRYTQGRAFVWSDSEYGGFYIRF